MPDKCLIYRFLLGSSTDTKIHLSLFERYTVVMPLQLLFGSLKLFTIPSLVESPLSSRSDLCDFKQIFVHTKRASDSLKFGIIPGKYRTLSNIIMNGRMGN